MSEPRLSFVSCLGAKGLHRMAYWEWGERANPRVLLCAHGLARQGRDFDTLARQLLAQYRVVCPDVVGRGRSDRLSDPMGYVIATYLADMVTLLARLDVESVDWIGTSMGGLIGMMLAGLDGNPIRRLVLNDVGPRIEAQSLLRIGTYLGKPVRFESLDQAAAAMWVISSSFGPHTREQWLELTRPQVVDDGTGGLVPHYDPAIAVPFRALTPEVAAAGEAAMWQAYDRIACPTLLLRGASSDLLSSDTALEMTRRGPKARLHEFEGVGHAPTLVQEDQRRVVAEFLLSP